MNRIDSLKYGTNQIGETRISPEGSWFRYDIYRPKAGGDPSRERRFCLDRHDYSPLFIEGINGKYDSRCACCYLGFSHTSNYHADQLQQFEPGTCPRCNIGSKRECTCTFDGGAQCQ